MRELRELYDAIVNGDAVIAKTVTQQALHENVDPLRLVNEFMAPAMEEVGQRFERSDYFVPELLLSARAMKTAMELIRPLLTARGAESLGRVVIGTVRGDLHDIGKNLVAAMLEGGGFEVIDLGVNVPAEKFIQAAREKNANMIAMSALLTTTMTSMKVTIEAITAAGLRNKVKVFVGGAPLSQSYAAEIGADGYGSTAVDAVHMAKQLMAKAA